MGPHSHVVTAARPDERRSAMTGPTNKDEWRRHIRATSVSIPADVATAVQTYLLELLADIPGLVLGALFFAADVGAPLCPGPRFSCLSRTGGK